MTKSRDFIVPKFYARLKEARWAEIKIVNDDPDAMPCDYTSNQLGQLKSDRKILRHYRPFLY